MKDAAITYGGLCVPQGQTKHGNAPILDTGYSMPITVVNGAFDGPTVLITSGIHGGESVSYTHLTLPTTSRV